MEEQKLNLESNQMSGETDGKNRASKIKNARDVAGRIFMLYDEKDKVGEYELNKATDAIYAYINELERLDTPVVIHSCDDLKKTNR